MYFITDIIMNEESCGLEINGLKTYKFKSSKTSQSLCISKDPQLQGGTVEKLWRWSTISHMGGG